MKVLTEKEIKEVLEKHKEWCSAPCGTMPEKRANLRSANLSSANLRSANLSSANLSSANLSSANLSSANLRSANLSSADLSWANLSSANLSWADLSWANLSSANLSSADLSSADLSSADLPSHSVLLNCNWDKCDEELTKELMIYDAWVAGRQKEFDAWANGGECPYANFKWMRAATFKESKKLWLSMTQKKRRGNSKAPHLLIEMCFKQHGVKR